MVVNIWQRDLVENTKDFEKFIFYQIWILFVKYINPKEKKTHELIILLIKYVLNEI